MKTLALFLLMALPASACELLVKAVDPIYNSSLSTNADNAGRTRKGMMVVVMEDGHEWGTKERLPLFVVIKIPGVDASRVAKYLQTWTDTNGVIVRARLWQLRWDDLPLAARNKLAAGGLTIKVGTYSGPYDYTWAQVKAYFRNLETGLDETADL